MEEENKNKIVVNNTVNLHSPERKESNSSHHSTKQTIITVIGSVLVAIITLIGTVYTVQSSNISKESKINEKFSNERLKVKLALEKKFNQFIKTKDEGIKKEIASFFESGFLVTQAIDNLPPMHKEIDMLMEDLEVAEVGKVLTIDSLQLNSQSKPDFLKIKLK